MKQINELLAIAPATGKQPPALSLVKKYAPPSQLPVQEKQALTVKYALPALAKMDDGTAIAHLYAILKRIKIVTGWEMPELKEDRQLLVMELLAHFRENHPAINPEEIAFAVRKFGTSVRSWGKDINLSLLDEILNKYMQERKELSEAERTRSENALPPAPFKMDWAAYAEDLFQNVRAGKFNIGFWMAGIYDFFVQQKYIAADSWQRYTDEATTWLLRYYEKLEDYYRQVRNYQMCSYIADKSAALIADEPPEDVRATAQKICVVDFFKKLIADGVKTIVKDGKDM